MTANTRNEAAAELARRFGDGEMTLAEFQAEARTMRIADYEATLADPGDLPADVVARIRDVLLPAARAAV